MQPPTAATRQFFNRLALLAVVLLLTMMLSGLWWLVETGEQISLNCSRIEPGKPVNCVVPRRWYWMIPGGEEEIRDVRGARGYVDRNRRDFMGEERWIHGVELLTARGYFHLNAGGPNSSGGAAKRINAFVRNPADKTLALSDVGRLNTESAFLFVIVLPTVFLLNVGLVWLVVRFFPPEDSEPVSRQAKPR